MILNFNKTLLYFLFALFCLTSCQDEINEVENPTSEETILPNSVLANLMSSMTANFDAADDLLDGGSCFSVELPVTVIVDGMSFIIDSEVDLVQLEQLYGDFSIDEEDIDVEYPITVIFIDYSEIVIENDEQLIDLINECSEIQEEYIECADFVYPLSFSVFDSEFSLIETVVVNNDQALHNFLNDLEEEDNTLIVSLNYPINLEYADGETIEVNTNEELSDAIEAAEQFCEDGNDNCVEDDILIDLMECAWTFTDGSGDFQNNWMIFNADGQLQISEGMAASAIDGSWDLSTTENGVVLTLSELTAFQETLEGDWLIVECEDGRLEIIRDDLEFTLEQDCNLNNPFSCFSNYEITTCNGSNNIPIYNLSANTIGLVDCIVPYFSSFHETLIDAENNTNAIENTEAFETLVSQVYLRIEAINGEYEIYGITLIAEDCNTGSCTEGDIEVILTSCLWNIINYNGSDNLASYNLDFEQDSGIMVVYGADSIIDAGWSLSQTDDGVVIAFSNVAAPNIQAINGSWLIVECTENQLVLHSITNSDLEIVLDRTCE
ncbi:MULTISPECIES: hypothetical protein [Winogradskyella]|uniref:hypothetical protein n=1 Tax=Winogradskyella TaxID=286104 RepID=UPI0015C7D9D0|nr:MULTISPECIES: hypothetical protein [Winogradskyella]QXP77927.1 hypothetical protein H0I32_11945 [Winogradskyella sp. HaHa_3_26]